MAARVTAPAPGAAVDRLRFGVCGCGHFETGYFTGYGRLAEEQFDFVFHTGDYIYEGRGDANRNPDNVRQHLGQEIYTLVDYRNRYAQYKSDPDLMAAHLSAPFIMTWDDHEVDNDYAGDRDERDTPPEIFLLRRAAAYQAYYESMPLRASTLPSGATLPLYRRLQFGNLIDLNVLDTRQYRSKQAACGDPDTCPELLDVRRTILGEQQEAWLFDNLSPGGAVDGARPAGADLRARHGQRERRVTLLGRQMGWLRGFAQATVRPSSATPRCRTRSCSPATCTPTGAPISRPISANPVLADDRRRVHQLVDHVRR